MGGAISRQWSMGEFKGLNCEEGGLKLNVSSEMTMHAIALGSALSFIGAVLAKLL